MISVELVDKSTPQVLVNASPFKTPTTSSPEVNKADNKRKLVMRTDSRDKSSTSME